MDFRSVQRSRTTLTELMMPAHANFGGKVHGGVLLALMDRVAYACAAKHAGGYCVTVSADAIEFRAPVEVGDLVSLKASLNHAGTSSMLVGVRVEAENVRTGAVRHTNTSYFTMVSIGDDGRPRQVPGLLLETRTEVRRYLEALVRIDVRNRHREALANEHTSLAVDAELPRLAGHRCQLAPGWNAADG
jgi:acyl-CoA hydrolase